MWNNSEKILILPRKTYGRLPLNKHYKTDVAAPFGGVKESGFEKDLGRDAVNEYMKTNTINMEYSI